MRYPARLLVLVALFVLLAALFYFVSPPQTASPAGEQTASPTDEQADSPSDGQADSPSDGQTSVTVLMKDGTVSAMTMAEYLPGAVAAEMPALFEPEALKAQAVAARTFVLSRLGYHGEADVCTDSACCLGWRSREELAELWGDSFSEYWDKICAACDATSGLVLTFEGDLAQAVFHASSAGMTEDSGAVWSAVPYLVSVDSPETADLVPNYVTTVSFACSIFAETLGLHDTGDPAQWVKTVLRDPTGRVSVATIQDKDFTGTELRAAFNLRSTAFTLTWDGDNFVFTVTGSGHGVGMSQYGAQAYALQGWTYDEILSHYYPGTQLTRN
jgi:stage II sporulation protein D